MSVEWMGRYRELVAALLQHANLAARVFSYPHEIAEDLKLKPHAWQVLEYLIEHETETVCMTRVSDALGIPQSSFSKIARQLADLGLVERFRTSLNRKNVLLKPTDKAREVYASHSQQLLERFFHFFFDRLDALDDASIAIFAQALNDMNQSIETLLDPPEEFHLIKDA